MIRFTVTLILVDVDECELQLRIRAEKPVEAARKAFDQTDESLPRKPEIGDCVKVINPDGAFTGYYIYDAGAVPRCVPEGDFIIWRSMMKTNPTRKIGVDAAFGLAPK